MAGVDAVHGTEQLSIALKMLKLFIIYFSFLWYFTSVLLINRKFYHDLKF